MRARPALYYDLRLSIGLTSVLPMLALPALGLINRLTWYANDLTPRLIDLIRPFELVLPLLAGLAAAHLMTLEHDERFAELRRTYPEPRWRLPLMRTGAALLVAFGMLAVGALVYLTVTDEHSMAEVLFPAFAPTVFLIGLSLFVSTVTRVYWVAAGAVMLYWFMEMQSRGAITGHLYLFRRSVTTYENEWIPYDLNRLAVMLAGLALLLLSGYIHTRQIGKGKA